MFVKDLEALKTGDRLVTTNGHHVVFERRDTVDKPASTDPTKSRTLNCAVVRHRDGRRETLPARSVHKDLA
ncbi:hypothetical protein [Actinomadura violacea]|uniref:Hint domain-containing protein n=1 Tax=Actinomadura violacea TaxID=2819934 RepID=A0ABS3RXU8_9ACTN|nr:hypothetical protein [Actinomadura violacea]MBO2461578.1 hypothetical protein [Actinomadura violacea]